MEELPVLLMRMSRERAWLEEGTLVTWDYSGNTPPKKERGGRDVFQQQGLGSWSEGMEGWMVLKTGTFLSKTCLGLRLGHLPAQPDPQEQPCLRICSRIALPSGTIQMKASGPACEHSSLWCNRQKCWGGWILNFFASPQMFKEQCVIEFEIFCINYWLDRF